MLLHALIVTIKIIVKYSNIVQFELNKSLHSAANPFEDALEFFLFLPIWLNDYDQAFLELCNQEHPMEGCLEKYIYYVN